MTEDFQLGFSLGIFCTVLSMAFIGYVAAVAGLQL